MNLDKLQKINMLASELQKHNQNLNSVDAAAQAGAVFDGGQAQAIAQQVIVEPAVNTPVQVMQIQPEVQTIQEEAQPIQNQQTSSRTQSASLQARRFELILEKSSKENEEQFDIMRNAINTLAAELTEVRGALKKLQLMQPKEIQVPLKTQSVQKQAEKKESHPRQGNFTPADVDIQKMFYFGNK